MNMYNVVEAIALSESLASRASRLVSALAHDLAERDEDETLLEELLCAAEDHGLTLSFQKVCGGCLKDFPRSGEMFCDACKTELAATNAALRAHRAAPDDLPF